MEHIADEERASVDGGGKGENIYAVEIFTANDVHRAARVCSLSLARWPEISSAETWSVTLMRMSTFRNRLSAHL